MTKNKIIIICSIVAVLMISVILYLFINPVEELKEYKVTFDSNGGSEVTVQIIKEGELATKPSDPIKEGYIFIGWQNKGVLFNFNTEITEDITLIAKWEKVESEEEIFVVKFDTDGGSTIPNAIIKKGENLTSPEEPKRDGYTFEGWFFEDEEFEFDKEITANITLVAKWKKIETNNNNSNNNNNNNSGSGNNNPKPSEPTVKKYTVSFDSKGGSTVSSKTVEVGSTVSKPSDPTRSGYTFKGWTLNGNSYDFGSKVTKDITLVAKWEEVIVKKYTVSFDSNGGSVISDKTVDEGSKVSKPNDPTRNGYNFAGWTLNGSSYDFSSSVTGNITLIANWTQKNYRITISAVDDYSPARILTVYEEGTQITVREIRYTNGTYLCSGENPNVNKKVVSGITSFKVVLSDGTEVTATVS